MLEVRSVSGKPFHRCGLAFGETPVIVSEEECGKKLGPPSYVKGITVGEVLQAEKGLVCKPVATPAAVEDQENKNGRRR